MIERRERTNLKRGSVKNDWKILKSVDCEKAESNWNINWKSVLKKKIVKERKKGKSVRKEWVSENKKENAGERRASKKSKK